MPDAPTPLTLAPVTLASASAARAGMLRAAGVAVETYPAGLDEKAMVDAMAGDRDPLPPADVAAVLAEAKAQAVSAEHPGRLVIGADQTLDLDGELFLKAESREALVRNLLRLRGRTHALHSAAALVRDGETLWSLTETAWLTMRPFTPEFLGRYVAAAGEAGLSSVGGYQLEGPGAQLFERVEGDWFVILGLPLIPLLAELRRLGALEA